MRAGDKVHVEFDGILAEDDTITPLELAWRERSIGSYYLVKCFDATVTVIEPAPEPKFRQGDIARLHEDRLVVIIGPGPAHGDYRFRFTDDGSLGFAPAQDLSLVDIPAPPFG